ncbi:hypothetical protein AMTRI_Chr02g257990 [Amborella trichopoda]|uniref:Peptidase A1 domain-containing protein n=1 Tax=Amborella trichopoda TaxID=13333 RepID=U5D2R7_AMBTC|nr:aspartic proteinase CDR1 [Amborella trichopoda]ERN16724.1 hypothetical protein AMTR_s00183p00040950 [Amborella trichopoda]|eukprot:XP_006855257.1 aspartic proteinase CDR1 [Amborella trichopoda]
MDLESTRWVFVLMLLVTVTSNSLFRMSSSATKITGLRQNLIHRDSLQSPFYTPNVTDHDRMRQAARRSIARHQYFRSALDGYYPAGGTRSPATLELEYIMKVGIGTPQKDFFFIIDSGSDMMWTVCKHGESVSSARFPIYDPAASSSYQTIGCNETLCKDTNSSCTTDCFYGVRYRDGTFSNGILAYETFTFEWDQSIKNNFTFDDSTHNNSLPSIDRNIDTRITNGQVVLPIDKIGFGCSILDTNPGFTSSGVVGFGGGPLSLISQLSSRLPKKFAYCLPNNGTGVILMGDYADIKIPGIKLTPIYQLPFLDTLYFLNLEDISVGSQRIGLPPGIFDPSQEKKKLFIDSGSALTFLDRIAYDPLVKILVDSTKKLWTPDPLKQFNLCYWSEDRSGDVTGFPDITFHFKGEADWRVDPKNLFAKTDPLTTCFMLIPTDSLSIFGNLMQRNMGVEYDLVNERLVFAPADCTKI